MQTLQGWTPAFEAACGGNATLSCGAYIKQDDHPSMVHTDTVISCNAQPAAGKQNMRSCCCCCCYSLTRAVKIRTHVCHCHARLPATWRQPQHDTTTCAVALEAAAPLASKNGRNKQRKLLLTEQACRDARTGQARPGRTLHQTCVRYGMAQRKCEGICSLSVELGVCGCVPGGMHPRASTHTLPPHACPCL